MKRRDQHAVVYGHSCANLLTRNGRAGASERGGGGYGYLSAAASGHLGCQGGTLIPIVMYLDPYSNVPEPSRDIPKLCLSWLALRLSQPFPQP